MSVRFVRTIFILALLIVVNILPSSASASPLGDAPINDNFANAQILDGASGSVFSSNVNATKELDWEPNHATQPGSASIWFTWTAPSDGDMTFDTSGSDFDTVLAVYTWPNSTGPLIEAGSNDDTSVDVTTSSVTFNAVTGVTYYIAVDGYDGDMGEVTLNWSPGDSMVFQPPVSPTPDTSLTQPTVCPSPQIAAFTINPPEIKRGDSATLTWGAVTNANSAVIDNNIGGVPTPGSRQVRPDKNPTTYTLTANGCGGTITAQVSIGVFAVGPLYQGIPEGPTSFRPRLNFDWSNRSGYDGDKYLSNIEIQIQKNDSYQPFELTENFRLQGNGYQNRTPFSQGKYKIRFRWWMTDRQTHQRVSLKSAWSVICFNYNDNDQCQ